MYWDRVFLVHQYNPAYQGWFKRLWVVKHGVHVMLTMERDDGDDG